jgi:hypothetical protein
VRFPRSLALDRIKKVAAADGLKDDSLYSAYVLMPAKPTNARRTLRKTDLAIEEEEPDFMIIPAA